MSVAPAMDNSTGHYEEAIPPVVFSLERLDARALQESWTDLERRAEVTFFLSWSWIGTWVEQAGAPDFVLVGRAEGVVVCLGLLRKGVQRRHRWVRSRTIYLHESGKPGEDVIYIEYNGFLSDRSFGRLDPYAVAFLLSNRTVGSFDELQMGGVPEAQYEDIKSIGYKTQVYDRRTTAFVDLQSLRDGGGDYLAAVSANTRYQLRRALKIYESRGPLTLQPACSTEEALQFFEELGVLHEAAWRKRGPGGSWRFPFLVAFHRRVIEKTFPAGGVDIVRISCGDEPIGYVHCLVRGGWIGSYLSGFAYEEDNKVKPGLVCFYLYIQSKLKSGGEIFDFLAGDHRYKTSLGQPGTSMLWFRVQKRRPQLMIEQALRHAKQRIEALYRTPRRSLRTSAPAEEA